MSETIRRSLSIVSIVCVSALSAWWFWPHPALELRVERGGLGLIVDRLGHTTPLPETVFVKATGRVTRIRLENNDTTFQTLGLFSAPAGSARNYRVEPGVFAGFCSAHAASQTIVYVVQ